MAVNVGGYFSSGGVVVRGLQLGHLGLRPLSLRRLDCIAEQASLGLQLPPYHEVSSAR